MDHQSPYDENALATTIQSAYFNSHHRDIAPFTTNLWSEWNNIVKFSYQIRWLPVYYDYDTAQHTSNMYAERTVERFHLYCQICQSNFDTIDKFVIYLLRRSLFMAIIDKNDRALCLCQSQQRMKLNSRIFHSEKHFILCIPNCANGRHFLFIRTGSVYR